MQLRSVDLAGQILGAGTILAAHYSPIFFGRLLLLGPIHSAPNPNYGSTLIVQMALLRALILPYLALPVRDGDV